MNPILKDFAIGVLRLAGREGLQPLWENIHRASLAAMNFGTGARVADSGEGRVLDLIKERLAQETGPVVLFDVGANVGEFAAGALARFGRKDLHLFCFEPSRKTFRELSGRLMGEINAHLFNIGIGEESGSAGLYYTDEDSGIASVYNRRLNHFGISLENREEIELVSIDDFCADKRIKHIHFLKLDIEGHELAALKGASGMAGSGNIDYIQFEFGGCNIDSRTYFQDFFYFLNDRYRIYRVLKNGLFEVGKYMETHEVFVTTNYLAERRGIQA